MTTYPTTEQHFFTFKGEVEYWLELFGLTDWHVQVRHTSQESDGIKHGEDSGSISYDTNSRRALIALAKDNFGEEPLEHAIKQVAFHEVCHLLLADLANHAESRYTTQDEIERVEHGVIRRLEQALFYRTRT